MSIQSLASYNVSIQPVQPRTAEPTMMDSAMLQGLSALLAAIAPLLAKFAQQAPITSNPASTGVGNALPSSQMPGSSGPSGTSAAPGTTTVPGMSALPPADRPMDADHALETLSANFDNLKGKDGMVGRPELEAALANPKTSADVRGAAQFLLDNPGAFNKLDRADFASRKGEGSKSKFGVVAGEARDGRISKGDVNAALQDTPQTEDERAVAETLLHYKSSVLDGDGLLSRQEVGQMATGKMADGSATPPALQAAAQKLLANPALFDKLADGFLVANPNVKGGVRGGDKLGLEDLLTALRK